MEGREYLWFVNTIDILWKNSYSWLISAYLHSPQKRKEKEKEKVTYSSEPVP